MNELSNWLSSSADPTKVSATVSGIILGASSTIVWFAMTFLHLQITASVVSTLATGVGMTVGAIYFIYGLIRKVAIKVGTKKA